MFLSSWLESFQLVIRQSARHHRGRRRSGVQRRIGPSLKVESLETRSLLTPPILTPTSRPGGTGTGSTPPYVISHSSTFSDEPNGLDGTEIAIQLRDVDLPANTPITILSAVSNDVTILHSVDSPTSPNLTFRNEIGNPVGGGGFFSQLAYIQFSPGTALFGSTTITVTAYDSAFEFTTLNIPVQLNDAPSLGALSDISALEDSPPITVPLSQITAGGGADDPFNGGQNRILYASSTNLLLTGIPKISYDATSMSQIGSLQFAPTAGAPVSITTTGDNQAFITVTIEDAGPDNIVGKSYDPLTGDVTITNFNATLDNLRRTRTFQFTVIPVNDDPTIDNISNINFDEDTGPAMVTLMGITPGGGTSVLGNELQQVAINPDTTNSGAFTLTFDNGIHSYTTDPIAYNAPAVTSVDETLRLTSNSNGGFFTLSFANNKGAVTSLFDAIDDIQTTFSVDDVIGFPSAPFVISVNSEEMYVSSVTASPIPGNPNLATLSVVRGYHGTTATTHANDATVLEVRTSSLTNGISFLASSQTTTSISNAQTTFNVVSGSAFSAPSSLLAADVLSSDTSIQVVDPTPFIGVPQPFQISVNGELMTVTNITGNVFDVARANPVTHTTGDSVRKTITIRVDREEMFVTRVTGNQLTVVRGVNGTTAAAHGIRSAMRVDDVINVADASMFSASLPFEIRVDSEDMLVTNVVGNQLHVIRAIHGTNLVTHANGAVVSPLETTGPIASNATAIEVQTALEGLSAIQVGDVVATGGPIGPSTPVTITFAGGLAKTNLDNLTADRGGLFGDEVQQLSFGGSFSGTGTYTVFFTGGSDPIPFNADANQFRTILENSPGMNINPGDLIVTGGPFPGAPMTIQFTGQFANSNVPQMTVNATGLLNDEQQLLFLTGTPTGGTFRLTYTNASGTTFTTGLITYDPTPGNTRTNIETALEALTTPLVADVDVVEFSSTQWLITFRDAADFNHNALTVSTNNLTPASGTQIFTLEDGNTGIGFTTTSGGFTPTANIFELVSGKLSLYDALEQLSSLTAADIQVTGSSLPALPATVAFVGAYAGLDVPQMTVNNTPTPSTALSSRSLLATNILDTSATLTVASAASFPTIPGFNIQIDSEEMTVTAIAGSTFTVTRGVNGTTAAPHSAGANVIASSTAIVTTNAVRQFDGEVQHLTVLAVSNNPNVVPNPIVNYTSPLSSATLTFTNLTDKFGEADITVTVIDSGFDQKLETTSDNGVTITTFRVTVNPVNDLPTVRALPDISVPRNSGLLQIPLAGITAGGGETQALRVEAFSSNGAVIPTPSVQYTPGSTTGLLTLQPQFGATGFANIELRVTDSGLDGALNGTGDNGVTSIFFRVDVSDAPTLDATPTTITIPEGASLPASTFTLTGVTPGGVLESSQDVRITFTHTNPTLIPSPSVTPSTLVSPTSSADFVFQPATKRSGTDTFVFTITDAGPDNALGIDSSLVSTIGATDTVLEIQPGTEVNFPDPGVTPFKIAIGSEHLLVTASNLAFPYRYTVVRGVDGTSPSAHAGGSAVAHPNSFDNLSITRTITIIVTPVNDQPTLDDFVPNPFTIAEGSGLQIVSVSGISDGEAPGPSQPLTLAVASNDNPGLTGPIVVEYNGGANGQLKFTPVAGQSGTATIEVTVTDGGLDGNLASTFDNSQITKTLTIVVVPFEDLPTLNAISNRSILEDAASQLVTLGGISDGDAGTQELQITATSSNPALIPNPIVSYSSPNTTGQLTFQPVANQFGTATITVTVTDGGADLSIATPFDNVSFSRTFTVTVSPTNDAPTISTINGIPASAVPSVTLPAISEDAPLQTINLDGIGPGPFETQNVSVSVASNNPGLIPVSASNVTYFNGSPTGTITFQPAANKFGTATLTLTIMDAGQDGNLGTHSDNGKTIKNIVVVVNAANDAPTLDAVSPVSVNEESGQRTVNLTGISAGGGEAQILKVTPSVVASSIPGLITNLSVDYTSPGSTGVLKFTPAGGLFGTATIRVTVEDAGFDGVLATTGDNATFFRDIAVTINNVNDLPTLAQPSASTINKNGYLINSVTVTGISDGDLNTQVLTVTATSDNLALVPNPVVNFTQSGTSPSTALQSATLVFSPAPNQLGTANITVTVSDGVMSSVSKTFVLTVVDVNLPPTIDAPTPNPIALIEDDLTPQTILLSGISSGGTESQGLKITAVSSDPNAIVIDNGTDVFYSSPDTTGAVVFHPQPNAAGNFTVTITVTDDGGDGIFGNSNDNSISTTVDVQIASGNDDAPTLDAISNKVVATSTSPTLQTVNLSGIADGPFETGPVGVAIFSNDNPALVTGLTVNYTSGSTGTLTFTPAASSNGVANIVVRVTDGGSNTFDQAFQIYVVNPPTIDPIANPPAIAEDAGAQSFNLSNVTDGDTGVEGGTISVSSSVPGFFSSLTVTPSDFSSPTPSVNYTVASDVNGATVVTVTVTDDGPDGLPNTGDEFSVSQSFTVTVNADNDAPTLTAPATLSLTEDGGTGTINLTNIFAKTGALLDEATQPLRITASSADTSKVTISSVNYTSPGSTGSVVVAPVANASGGPVNVTITVEDGGTDNNLATPGDNQTFSQVVAVSITAVNDLPTLNALADVTVSEDSGMGGVNLSGITAGPGESQNLTVTATSSNQFVIPDSSLTVVYTSASPTGTLQFTPLLDAFGETFITVTVTDDNSIDGIVKSFSRTFKVRVNAVNDAPEIFGLLATVNSTVSPDGTTATINENLAVGSVVAVVDFDDDTPPSSLAVSIIAGNTGNAFSIASDGTIKVANAAAINFEANPTFNLTVKITDNNPIGPTPLQAQQTFTINLNDLTEVLTIGSANWPASGGLTLKRTGDGKVHVLNSSNADVVPAHVFANVSKIQVTGRSATADVLTVDYSGGDPVPVAAFDGLTFDGGVGAGDTLKFSNAMFNQLETTFNSATSASISDPDSILGSIGVVGVEALTFDATVSATNLSFLYGFGSDTVTFADDGNSSNGVSTFSSSSSPLVTFPAAAGVTVDVGDGNNTVTFNSIENVAGPAVTVLAGDGNDSLRASSVGRRVSFSADGGNDSLVGGSGADTLNGGDGNDSISGGLGNDEIDGGADTNTLYESADASFTVGAGTITGLGSDTFSNIDLAVLTGGAGSNTISAAGFGGQATINGAGGNDNLTGSSQDDVITGSDGNDTIDGGGGDDTLIESGNVNLVLGAATMTGLGADSISSIEFAKLTGGSGNNTLDASGFGGSVTLSGGAGNDILKGGLGDDSLSGDAGNDTLSGNAGSNTLNGGSETDQVLESANVDFTLLAAQLISILGTDDLISIETARLIGGGSDNTLDASAFTGKTTLQGGEGADTIIGGSNADSMEGGNGNDVMTGGLGNDTFTGGAGTDTIVEENLTSLSMTSTAMSGRGSDTISGIEAANLTGTAGNDTITGGSFAGVMTIEGFGGRDSLAGGAGADTIFGGAGNDTLVGGGGNDLIRGEEDHDRITGGTGNDSVDGGDGNDTINGEAGNDVLLGGAGNDSLNGGIDNDAIDGQDGDDKVFGDNGNDTLIGGFGKDSINGGAGNDKLWSGDYYSNSGDVSDGSKDTLVSGIGSDTVTGDAIGDLDVMTDASNTAAEKAAAFVIDYDSIFGVLLGP